MALALCVIPMLLESPLPALTALPISGWAALAWYGSIVTVAAYACMFTGAKYCDGYTIAAFTGFIPISSLGLSTIVLGETVAPHQLIGCVLIVSAILFMSRKDKHPLS